MKVYLTCSRTMLSVFLSVVLAVLMLCSFTYGFETAPKLTSEAQRQAFLEQLGFSSCGDPVFVDEITVPWEFPAVYRRYNDLQLSAGYNLMNFRGQTLTQYTYAYSDTIYIHLLFSNGEVVGGDICDPALNGQMWPLRELTDEERNALG